ncbi:hypothetical protein [Balneatrix alpica]|uniref:Uncharacterized protein n=1 Tax=Balneatrix alpica TaxID=75684 RepID=A0ABV5ZDH2_9GAMM|nr:hypothetical protein [Balneatrix alpica]
MEGKVKKTIKSASQTLTLLSKVRCVKSYSLSPEYKPKRLHSWPSQFESDDEVISLLKSNGVSFENHHRVKSHPVEYSLYKSLNVIDIDEISDIRVARTQLNIFQIISEGENIKKITAICDTSKHPERTIPVSMSDINGLNEFSKYRDSMLLIERENSKYDIKLPAFAYRSALEGIAGIEGHSIFHEDRSNFIGDNVDKKGRSKRFIVHEGNKDHLIKVLTKTMESIDKLVGDYSWVEILKKDGKMYYSKKI